MKKILIGVAIVVVAGGIYWWSMQGSAPASSTTTSAPSETLNPGTTGTGATATGNTNPPTSTPAPTIGMMGGTSMRGGMMSGYKSGTFTGPVVDSVYGPVQVAVTISGGKITAVKVPVFPSGNDHTNEVSAMAIPQLKQEAIAVQNAQVDIVSGATQTSEAFQQSLASALSQAS